MHETAQGPRLLQMPRPCVALLTCFIFVVCGAFEVTSHFASKRSSIKLANTLCIGDKHRPLPRSSTPVLHPERGTVHLRFCTAPAQHQLIAPKLTRQLCLAKAPAKRCFFKDRTSQRNHLLKKMQLDAGFSRKTEPPIEMANAINNTVLNRTPKQTSFRESTYF